MKEFEYRFLFVDHTSKKNLCVKILVFYNNAGCDKLWNPGDSNLINQILIKNSKLERGLYDKVTNMVITKLNSYYVI